MSRDGPGLGLAEAGPGEFQLETVEALSISQTVTGRHRPASVGVPGGAGHRVAQARTVTLSSHPTGSVTVIPAASD